MNTKRIIYFTILFFLSILVFNCDNESVEQTNSDLDNDGIINTIDNCTNIANPNQEDTDGNGIGDACDEDIDGDGILNSADNCPNTANSNQEDADQDGIGDLCDINTDTDNDGIDDGFDNCPNTANPNQEDTDGNGIGDACDNELNFTPLNVCENGFAGQYPCSGYDLMGYVSLTDLGGTTGNDSWGWVDTSVGKEYALVGTNATTTFVDITDPTAPIVVGFLPTATGNSSWRDIKVYNNHAFIVSEASGHGMQVFDLTRLQNVTNPPETFTADAHYTGFGNAHNIVINESSGYAYAVGTTTFSGGPHFVNIQDPLNPIAAGGYANDSYSHDAQVITYNGPDSNYVGKEILIGSNENEVVIVDVTDKANPVNISDISYSNIGYTHQGWFTDDMRYFILGDELDEQANGFNSRTIVFDFSDLDNPTLHFEYYGSTAAIDHNGYVNGNTYYLANYSAGVRFLDITNIENGTMTEIGFFDTYPGNNNANFNGAWSVYPYFPSGNIVVSDINRGLFIIRESE